MAHFFIEGNVVSSKNNYRIAGNKLVHSGRSNNWYSGAISQMNRLRKAFRDECVGLPKPIIIGFHFVRDNNNRFDFINPLEAVQDAMTKAGWIDDDNIKEMLPVPAMIDGEWFSMDKKKPGVHIFINSPVVQECPLCRHHS